MYFWSISIWEFGRIFASRIILADVGNGLREIVGSARMELESKLDGTEI